jgi:hypothetical protein
MKSFRLPFTSALKMELVRFSKTLASTSQSTRHPNPDEHHQYHHHHENLKSQLIFLLYHELLGVCVCIGELK